MKKILIFLPSWGLGGSTIYLSQYVKYFISKNYDVYCVCRRKDSGSEYLNKIGAKNIFIHFPISLSLTDAKINNELHPYKLTLQVFKIFAGFFTAVFFIIKLNPNLVLIGDITLLQIFFSTKLLNRKDIVVIQTDIIQKKLRNYLIQKSLIYSNLIIGITKLHINQLNERVVNKYFIPNTIISHCSNVSHKKLMIFDSLKIDTKYIFLFLGGISNIKGSYDFIKLANEIVKIRNDVSFILAGAYNRNFSTEYSKGSSISEYEYNQRVFKFIEKNGLKRKIKIIGETDFALKYIEKSTIVVSMNDYPHFSRPIIEAWSMKKAVIANDDKYSRNLIENGKNGFLANKFDLNDWINKCNLVLDNAELRNRLGNNGYEKFKKYYCEEKVMQKMNLVFEV